MESKTCGRCGQTKPITEFYRAKNGKAQPRPVVKSACKECQKERARQWQRDNPERQRKTAFARNLRRWYGMTVEEYEARLEAQGGVCAVCRREQPSNGYHKNFSVDHDHTTGKVRGLLCNACNRALGLLKDDVDLLRRMINYLEEGSNHR